MAYQYNSVGVIVLNIVTIVVQPLRYHVCELVCVLCMAALCPVHLMSLYLQILRLLAQRLNHESVSKCVCLCILDTLCYVWVYSKVFCYSTASNLLSNSLM